MKVIINSLIALMMLSSAVIFTQDDKVISKNPDASFTSKAPTVQDYLFNQPLPDYKILSSNASFIEIEYNLQGQNVREINFNGERLSVYEFNNGLSKNTQSGSPDMRCRSFGLMLPSHNNNTVQVIDYDMKEEQGVTIAPVPQMYFPDPNVRSFENILYSYNKNSDYTQNKFIPENPAELISTGLFRDIPSGNLVINPYQYNPVTRTLKIYNRIRVRVTFGETPIMLGKPRSYAEMELLKGAALNSLLGIGWTSPEYKSVKRTVTNSLLNSGDWYKIEIKDIGDGQSEGMYKITKGFLESAGINLSGVDARTIKMYGNGGELLPDWFSNPRPDDLQETAVYFEGEADGSFDANDYILFYARAINNWRYDSLGLTYNHYVNYHSRSNYYWICLNTPGTGLRMQVVPSENSGSAYVPSSFMEKIFDEPERNNLISEGNLWLGDRKNPGQSIEWNPSLTGLEGGTDILYRVKMAARCLDNVSYFLVKDEYSTMSEYQVFLNPVYAGFGDWISTTVGTFVINQSQKTNGEQVKLKATYYAPISEGQGYEDWFEILYKRRLNSAQNDRLRFTSPDTAATVEYNVSSFSSGNIKVFDATSHNTVKIITPLSVSPSNVRFQKNEISGQVSKYLVIGQNGHKDPTGISSRVPNQNLHGITEGYHFIIITHRDFVQAAERLKTKREQGGPSNPDYLKTLVVTVDQIYNEFSGGVLDAVAIRDFIKYGFDNWQIRPTHVCLFGDGSFDYKDILQYGKNYVPAWEYTSPTINQVAGFTSDDYYVNVTGTAPFPIQAPPDIAVGRIPAASIQEANEYMDKVDAYENGENNGYWKNRMLFVADDERTSEGCEFVGHLNQIEGLAEQYTPPFIDKVKAYLITYPTVITPAGRRKPQVNSDIARYWNEGMLNIHWTGHGSPDVWAHEYVLEKDVIMSQINNINKYPFVSIASCDMSKFDNPANKSAGELFMITGRKGAIGTLAATRPVYASGNDFLMKVVFGNLYIPRDTLLLQKRFGTGVLDAKVQLPSYSENDAKYVLMCDPTLRTQIPRFRSHIDSISGLSGDTMKALSRIKIYGSILKPDSTKWDDFNGKILLKLYDVDRIITMTDECVPPSDPDIFRLNGGIIYSGTQNIVNGRWVVEYIVPKDISYLNQPGRLINYFYNNQYDGAGINRNFIVGGINPNAEVDSVGPRISMFLNNRNFRTGDMVSENFKFIADLFDESGINTTGTIGHKLEATLDGNENNKYDMTNFYNSDTSYKSGTIEFDFSGISVGSHSLRLKAWDTYNNSTEATIEFRVTTSGAVQVTDIYNYPNPFKDNTVFTFHHNYPGDINVKIKIYTVAGRLIKEISPLQPISDKFVSINWDGKDADGETLGNGIYIYKLIVESFDGTSVTNVGKLAVLK